MNVMKGEVDLENLVGPHISVFFAISRKMARCEQTTFLWFSVLIVIFARTKRNGLMGEPLLVFFGNQKGKKCRLQNLEQQRSCTQNVALFVLLARFQETHNMKPKKEGTWPT